MPVNFTQESTDLSLIATPPHKRILTFLGEMSSFPVVLWRFEVEPAFMMLVRVSLVEHRAGECMCVMFSVCPQRILLWAAFNGTPGFNIHFAACSEVSSTWVFNKFGPQWVCWHLTTRTGFHGDTSAEALPHDGIPVGLLHPVWLPRCVAAVIVLLPVAKRGSLSINALSACVYLYIQQLGFFRAPTEWFIDLTVATCHIQYTFLSLCNFFNLFALILRELRIT